MDTPTMSTLSLSTAMGRRTCLRMTSASICGTWASRTAASVSFVTLMCFLYPHAHFILIPLVLINYSLCFLYLLSSPLTFVCRIMCHWKRIFPISQIPRNAGIFFFCTATQVLLLNQFYSNIPETKTKIESLLQ